MDGYKILTIDDDPDLVQALGVILRREGMEQLAAYGGVEGLEKARNEKPDLIVLDVMMDDKDGFQVAREIARDSGLTGIPVVMLTAVADHAATTDYTPQSAISSLEADDWFEKPVDPEALVRRIKELLR